jgi:hypothetical protein
MRLSDTLGKILQIIPQIIWEQDRIEVKFATCLSLATSSARRLRDAFSSWLNRLAIEAIK